VDIADRVRDIPTNESYSGLVAEAYDTWMPYDTPYDDAPLFQQAIVAGDGPALELACGTGRLLIRYLEAGLDVDGVDNAPDMLAICARNARTAGVEATLHTADITTLALERRYATIYNPAGSFMLHDDVDVARGALRAWAAHLRPGGRLLVGMGVPRDDFGACYEWRIRRSAMRPTDGITFLVHEAVHCDVDAQLQTVINRLEVYDADGRLQETLLRRARLRWWEREQLEQAFVACGLEPRTYGAADEFLTVGTAPA
jgi:SAM-dependent methyltransferase